MTGRDKMPFGKYKGDKLSEVDTSYLIWFFKQEWAKKSWPDLYKYVKRNWKKIVKEELRWRRIVRDVRKNTFVDYYGGGL